MAGDDEGQRPFPVGPACPSETAGEPLLYRFYYQMTLIRRFEEQFVFPYTQCPLPNWVQASTGLEACDVGVINALDSTRDLIFSTYRAHGHFIAYNDDISGFTGAGLSGALRTGNRPNLHRFNMCASGGESKLIHGAMDAALACRRQGLGAICAVFLNRKTAEEAMMQEIGNVSSFWSLPILFVLADNSRAQNPGGPLAPPEETITNTFQSASQFILADDVLKVYAFARAAVAYVRSNCNPFLLKLQANWALPPQEGEDSSPEDLGVDRPKQDPLTKITRQLTPQARELIEAFVEERIREAVEKA